MPERPPKPPDRESTPRFKERTGKPPAQSRQTLASLQKSRPNEKDYKALWHELACGAPRSVALVGAAYLEDVLRFSLAARFISMKTPELHERLYKAGGPLNSFGQAIELAYALGLYGPMFYEDLHTVRKIRNTFAHSMKLLTFETEEIANEIAKLRFIYERTVTINPPLEERTSFTIRELTAMGFFKWTNHSRYIETCKEVAARIAHDIDWESRPKPSRLP
jgi:DNA-binding MltR family transcriptional regulator